MAQVGYIRIKFIPRMVFGTQDLNNQRDGYREKDNSNETCRKKDPFFHLIFTRYDSFTSTTVTVNLKYQKHTSKGLRAFNSLSYLLYSNATADNSRIANPRLLRTDDHPLFKQGAITHCHHLPYMVIAMIPRSIIVQRHDRCCFTRPIYAGNCRRYAFLASLRLCALAPPAKSGLSACSGSSSQRQTGQISHAPLSVSVSPPQQGQRKSCLVIDFLPH
ncbi:hypothetical protein [Kosakonia sp. SOY2]|uniref:hypothetical protein n=1 Tax=Kosakonia sp. SOY2 TaxID=3014557 RepID=UPI003FA55FED